MDYKGELPHSTEVVARLCDKMQRKNQALAKGLCTRSTWTMFFNSKEI